MFYPMKLLFYQINIKKYAEKYILIGKIDKKYRK